MRTHLWLIPASALLGLALVEGGLRRHPPAAVYMVTRDIIQRTASQPIEGPVLGYVPRAGLTTPFCNLEFCTTVKINAQNMRDTEYPLRKPKETRRVIAIGDSFVFGWGVEDKERTTELLEDRFLQKVEVLNLGVSGYSADQALEWLKVRGLAFNPDIVLFFTLGFPSTSHEEYGFEDGTLYWADALKQSPLRKLKNHLTRNIYTLALVDWAIHAALSRGNPGSSVEGWDETILKRLAAMARSSGFKPVVVYFPDKDDLREPSRRIDDFSAACRQQGLGFLDLTPALTSASYFKHDDHWNRHGHEVAAGKIAGYLFDNALLEPGRKRLP